MQYYAAASHRKNFWGKIWAALGNIKILHPPKNSISYGYPKMSFIPRQYSWYDRHSPLLNNFSEACPMVYRFSPPLDKFNLPNKGTHSVISGIAKVRYLPYAQGQNYFLHLHQQKLQFEVKNRCKGITFVSSVYF